MTVWQQLEEAVTTVPAKEEVWTALEISTSYTTSPGSFGIGGWFVYRGRPYRVTCTSSRSHSNGTWLEVLARSLANEPLKLNLRKTCGCRTSVHRTPRAGAGTDIARRCKAAGPQEPSIH